MSKQLVGPFRVKLSDLPGVTLEFSLERAERTQPPHLRFYALLTAAKDSGVVPALADEPVSHVQSASFAWILRRRWPSTSVVHGAELHIDPSTQSDSVV